MVDRNSRWNRRRLDPNRPKVLVLSANGNTVTDGDGDLFTVRAGPFGEVFVRVSEDDFNGLPCHALNDISLILGNKLK